jgi:hypothetical protein
LSEYAFLDPGAFYRLPSSFDYEEYIETERELWALFPETDGKRVNFIQVGLTAQIFAEVPEDASELGPGQTYVLMPCPDRTMRPLRMAPCRRLTLSEYRMGHLTAVKLIGRMSEAREILMEIGHEILGPEVIEEVEARLRGDDDL